jgi:hypothetical protein
MIASDFTAKRYWTKQEAEDHRRKYGLVGGLIMEAVEETEGGWIYFSWFKPDPRWKLGSAMGAGPTVWRTKSKKVAFETSEMLKQRDYESAPSI